MSENPTPHSGIEQPTTDQTLPLSPEQIVREHIGSMLALARRIMGSDPDAAEDVVQDAFINAFQALNTLQNTENIKPWLHRITVNAALMKLRLNKRLSEQPIDEYLPEFDRNDCRLEERWSYLARLEDVQANQNQLDMLNTAFFSLPQSYRIALQLRDIEGYSTKEMAEALDISESNAKTRVHRARSSMKKLIEPLLRGEIN